MLNRLKAACRALVIDPVHPKDPVLAEWLRESGGISDTAAVVTRHNMLEVPAVFASVSRISNQLGRLPIKFYKTVADDKREIHKKHPLYLMLHNAPNSWQTAFEFKQLMTVWLLLYGNAYAEIITNPVSGQISELIPIEPWRVTPSLKKDANKWVMSYTVEENQSTNRVLLKSEMFHLKGMGLTAEKGVEVWRSARKAIGLAQTLEDFLCWFFHNRARPDLVFKHPAKLGDPAWQRLTQSLMKQLQGVRQTNKAMVLEEGLDIKELSVTNDKSQMLDSRKYQTSEIARIMGVQPHLIGDLDKSSFNNMEHQGREFLTMTIDPILTLWEQAIWRDLLNSNEKRRYYAEFDRSSLVQADVKTMNESFQIGINNGWLSINDVRRMLNMAPVEGGDKHYVQMQMQDITQQNVAQPPAPVPPPSQETPDHDLPDPPEQL